MPLARDAMLDEERLTGDLSGTDASYVRLLDCVLEATTLDDVRLDGARAVDTVVRGGRATSLSMASATWQDAVWEDVRWGAVQAGGAELTRLTVRGGRIDYLGARGARLLDVALDGARIDELDLGGATVRRLVTRDTRIGHLVLRGATCEKVDLRGASIESVDGVTALRGATLTFAQVIDLAPAFAEHLGIRIA